MMRFVSLEDFLRPLFYARFFLFMVVNQSLFFFSPPLFSWCFPIRYAKVITAFVVIVTPRNLSFSFLFRGGGSVNLNEDRLILYI